MNDSHLSSEPISGSVNTNIDEESTRENSFKTPDEVATNDNAAPESNLDKDSAGKQQTKKWWQLDWPPSKRQIIASVVIVVLTVGGAGVFALTRRPALAQPIVVSGTARPRPIVSPLTGLPTTKAGAKLPITGVMIENTPDARPQSGLSSAGVVYEAIAEAGITRFLALYQSNGPINLGPVRSARPYFLRWADGYQAAYAHVGGSPEALSDINQWGIRDIGQFGNPSYYHRINTRYAPHNMYTSLSQLSSLEKSKGYTTSTFQGFTRKRDQPSKSPTATTISMDISYSDYSVLYKYDSKTNRYLRFEGGQPQIDANNNKQLAPNVVVALVIPYSYGAIDTSGAYYSVYNNLGSGPAYIFEDGGVVKATWQKASLTSPLRLIGANGKDVPLDAGQTWLTALSSSNELSYQPAPNTTAKKP